jgi:hypothetical protein
MTGAKVDSDSNRIKKIRKKIAIKRVPYIEEH